MRAAHRSTSYLVLASILGAVALAGLPHAPMPAARDQAESPGRTGPGDWFYLQRAYPFGEIPAEKLDEARTLAVLARAGLPAAAAGPVWQPAGPFNIGGRVTALAAKPGSTTIWLGAAFGGVWKSVNGGTNWTCTTDRTPIASVGALAMHPFDENTVYVGTGEANASVDSYDGDGLYVTRDGGTSWEHLGLRETRRIGAVAMDPSNPQRMFVAAMGSQFSTGPDRGLYRSENGGASWSKVLFVNDSTGVCDVVLNPAHPETMWCATWERVRHYTYRRAFGPGGGIWRSVDGGTSWTKITAGLPPANDNLGRIGLAVAPSRPSTVYAQIGTGSSGGYRGLGFYRSVDGGTTWARRDIGTTFTNAFGGFCWYFGATAVDPSNPDRVWALGVDALRSTDGGSTWTSVIGSAHVDQHAMWIDPANPSRVLLGNDGGFFSSTVGGGSWVKSFDLPISQFYAGSVAAYDAEKLMGGTQDNNSLLTDSGPTGWFPTLGGDGFVALADPVVPTTLFAEWQNGCSATGPRRSTTDGSNWTVPTGFTGTDRYNWSMPYTLAPSNHNELLAGTQRVYRSLDNGVSYAPISADLTRNLPSLLTFSTIATLAVSPADPNLYLAGTDDGRVWKSTNHGSTWVEITAGLPIRSVTRVASDPSNAQVIYVTLSGFGQDEALAHVYRSADQGLTWTSIAGNLPDVPANDILPDPLAPGTLYLATDLGVSITRNGGQTWWDLGAGLPLCAVFDLELHAASRTLVAFTHGRSAWKLPLSDLPVGAPAGEPAALALSAPAPNPSRGGIRAVLALGRPGLVDAAVFDAQGRRLATLVRGALPAGRHALAWDARTGRGDRARAGAYWLRVASGGEARVARFVVTD